MTEETIAREEAEEKALYDTVGEERILLKYLFTQIISARKYFIKVNEEIFTSPIRIWLFRRAKEIFRETHALFDEATIKAELDRVKKIALELIIERKRIVRNIDHVKAMGEWNLIYATDLKHTPEWLIDDLERKKRAKAFMESAEKAVQKVLEGESDDAISDLNSDLIRIKSGIFTEKPLRRLSDASWQVETFRNKQAHPERYAGINVGFPIFDKRAGAYRGELILITAHTGVGKSTLLRSIAMGAAANGSNVLFIVNEEIEEQAGNKFASMYTKMHYRKLKTADPEVLSEAGIKKFEDDLKEFGETHGEIFIQELPQFHTCADIEQLLVELDQRGDRIDLVILDYLDHLKPMEKSWSETDEQSKATAEFKSVCMQFRVAGITATQADTASVDMSEMNAYNVRGSKQKSGAANVVIAIKELASEADKDVTEISSTEIMTWRVMIIKNRDGGKFSFFARFHRTSGTVVEYDKETADPKEREEVEKDIKAALEAASKKGRGKGKYSGSKSPSEIKKDGLPIKEHEETEKHKPMVEDKEVTSIAHALDDISDEELAEPKAKPPFVRRSTVTSELPKEKKLPPGGRCATT